MKSLPKGGRRGMPHALACACFKPGVRGKTAVYVAG